MAPGNGRGSAGGAARHRVAAISGDQPGARRAVQQPDPLAEPLACGAAELGVLPERFRRPHFKSRDADRPRGAREPGLVGDGDLVRRGLRHHRHRDARGGRSLARDPGGALVRRLHRPAGLFRAAHAGPLQGHVGGAFGADGAHRRQLHQHPDGQAVRAAARRGRLRQGCLRLSHRPLSRGPAADHRLRHAAGNPQRPAGGRLRRPRPPAVAPRPGRGRRHSDGAAAHVPAHQHVALDRIPDHRDLRRNRRGAGGHADHRPAAAPGRPERRRCARRAPRRDCVRQCAVRLRPRADHRRGRRASALFGSRRLHTQREARREDRPRRALGRRQIDRGRISCCASSIWKAAAS